MKNKSESKQKGITLIALVITIVILLILAGISISALTNTGLFGKAKEAKQKSENAQNEENVTLSEYEDKINEYLPGTTGSSSGETQEVTLASKVQPGDYVAYTPDTASTAGLITELETYSGSTANSTSTLKQETDLKWRVLDVKDGKVRLISELPTTSTISLSGAKGYNNAVYLLDKTCSTLYNNSTYAEKVQSLKIEDIQDHLTYDYTQYANSYVDTGKYGGTKTYANSSSSYRYYPNLFAKEKTGWVDEVQGTELNLSEQTTPIDETSTQAGTSIKITQTYWYKSMAETDFKDSIYYNLFINNGSNYSTYWMSSRCVRAGSNSADFRVRYVHSGGVGADYL